MGRIPQEDTILKDYSKKTLMVLFTTNFYLQSVQNFKTIYNPTFLIRVNCLTKLFLKITTYLQVHPIYSVSTGSPIFPLKISIRISHECVPIDDPLVINELIVFNFLASFQLKGRGIAYNPISPLDRILAS